MKLAFHRPCYQDSVFIWLVAALIEKFVEAEAGVAHDFASYPDAIPEVAETDATTLFSLIEAKTINADMLETQPFGLCFN